MHITSSNALEALAEKQQLFVQQFTHGTLKVEVYKPTLVDEQTPHDKDEVYIIIAGESEFINGDAVVHCKAGDFLFVPAGITHKFFNFSTNFSTWVLFYGPIGGKK